MLSVPLIPLTNIVERPARIDWFVPRSYPTDITISFRLVPLLNSRNFSRFVGVPESIPFSILHKQHRFTLTVGDIPLPVLGSPIPNQGLV